VARSKVPQQDAIDEGRVTETATVTKYALQAFIAAPPATDTSVLREELDRRGIYAYELDEVASAGMSQTELIDESIRRADLVVVVLGGEGRENVLVELGFALALKKRVLALVPPDSELPVEPVPYLRTRPDNREAIAFGLTQLLAAPGPSRPGKNDALLKTKPLGPIADELLRKWQVAGAQPDEQKLEEIVHDALTASGIAVMSRSLTRGSDSRADIAIWSDDFEPWVGNPFLIEVRTRIAGRGDLERVLGQISVLMEKTRTPWGLLLYCCEEDGATAMETPRHPRLFTLTIGQFLERLRETSLRNLLREMRNRRIHGKG
jgi:hypothetical protein